LIEKKRALQETKSDSQAGLNEEIMANKLPGVALGDITSPERNRSRVSRKPIQL